MKLLVALFGLCAFTAATHAADIGLEEVQALGRLNGQALACAQGDNIRRIKTVMIEVAPKSRQYGAAFEQTTHEAFLQRSGEQDACADEPVIALRVEELATRLRTMAPPREPQQ